MIQKVNKDKNKNNSSNTLFFGRWPQTKILSKISPRKPSEICLDVKRLRGLILQLRFSQIKLMSDI